MDCIPAACLLNWLRSAAPLPGKAPLQMAVLLQFLSIEYQRTEFILLTPEWLSSAGFSRVTAYRALGALERAELIEVERQQGKAPLVSIINCADSEATK